MTININKNNEFKSSNKKQKKRLRFIQVFLLKKFMVLWQQDTEKEKANLMINGNFCIKIQLLKIKIKREILQQMKQIFKKNLLSIHSSQILIGDRQLVLLKKVKLQE